jgi:GNAT superfamily N-acetyltransferase
VTVVDAPAKLVLSAGVDNDAVVWQVLRDGYGDRSPTLRQTRKLLWTGGVLLAGAETAAGLDTAAVAVVQRSGDCLEVLRLSVRPELQRRGWGRLLVGRLAKGPLPLLTYIRETNTVGLQFARAMGFAAVGVERGQFGEADGIRLERRP